MNSACIVQNSNMRTWLYVRYEELANFCALRQRAVRRAAAALWFGSAGVVVKPAARRLASGTMLRQWGGRFILAIAALAASAVTAEVLSAPNAGASFAAVNNTSALSSGSAQVSRQALNGPIDVSGQAIVDPVVDPLLRSVIERLAISGVVARAKFDAGTPVEDTLREREVLNTAVNQAPQYGVNDAQARAFFSDQIEASKLVQTILLARWRRAGEAPGDAIDLVTALRPQIDRLSNELLLLLGRVCALPTDSLATRIHQARERLAQEHRLGALERAALDQATLSLCLPSTQ